MLFPSCALLFSRAQLIPTQADHLIQMCPWRRRRRAAGRSGSSRPLSSWRGQRSVWLGTICRTIKLHTVLCVSQEIHTSAYITPLLLYVVKRWLIFIDCIYYPSTLMDSKVCEIVFYPHNACVFCLFFVGLFSYSYINNSSNILGWGYFINICAKLLVLVFFSH